MRVCVSLQRGEINAFINDGADQREEGQFDDAALWDFKGDALGLKLQIPVCPTLDFSLHLHPETFILRHPETLRLYFQLHITAGEGGFTADLTQVTDELHNIHPHD